MASSINNINFRDGLNEAEAKAAVELLQEDPDAFQALVNDQIADADDREKITKRIAKDAKEITSEYKDMRDDLKKELRRQERVLNGDDLSPAEKDDLEDWIRDTKKVLAELDSLIDAEIDQEITAALDEYDDRHIDASDDSETVISDVRDGETIYTFGGGGENPMAHPLEATPPERRTNMTRDERRDATRNARRVDRTPAQPAPATPAATGPYAHLSEVDRKFLQDEGIIDAQGRVLTDVDGNQVFNDADVQKALEGRAESGPDALPGGEQQTVVIKDGSWKLESYDASTGTYTWKVGDSTVIWKNASNVKVVFHTGVDRAEITRIDGQFPGLLKNMYWIGDDNSLNEYFHPTEGENVDGTAASNRLDAILGYAEVKAASGPYGSYVDRLYQFLNDYKEGADVKKLWKEMLKGLSPEAQKELINALAKNFAENGRLSDFEKLFGPAIGMLEDALAPTQSLSNLNQQTLATILLLELHGGTPGNFGGAAILGKFASQNDAGVVKEGTLKQHANNEAALAEYLAIIGRSSDFTAAGGARAAYNNEYVLNHGGNNTEGAPVAIDVELPETDGSKYTSARDEFTKIYHQMRTGGYGGDGGEYDNSEWNAFMRYLDGHLFDSSGNLVSDVWRVLLDAVDEVDGSNDDSVMMVFAQQINKLASPELKKAIYDQCGETLKNWINDNNEGGSGDLVDSWNVAA